MHVRKNIEKIGKIYTIKTCARDAPRPPSAYLKISGGIFHDCAVHDLGKFPFTFFFHIILNTFNSNLLKMPPFVQLITRCIPTSNKIIITYNIYHFIALNYPGRQVPRSIYSLLTIVKSNFNTSFTNIIINRMIIKFICAFWF